MIFEIIPSMKLIKTLRCALAVSSALLLGSVSARDRVVIVPAHPDDLIAALGFCHLARDVFEVHVVDLTHGERGCGAEKFKNGWTKAKRTAEEEAVCASVGAKLHWLDEIDGEAYACKETCEKLAALLKELQPRAVIAHWPVDVHTDHVMAGAAAQRAIFLAGIRPEIYFMEQTYQSKRFVPDVFVDITPVYEKVWASLRLYECQYRDGGMERRRKESADFYGLHSGNYYGAKCEGFMSFVPPLNGAKTIFAELPAASAANSGVPFQGAK